MPQSIKDWYIKNKSDRLQPVDEYQNDELGDVWDMEMVADYKPKPKVQDTIQKVMDSATSKDEPAAPKRTNLKKDSAALLQKKKKKITRPKNVNHNT
jgi:hypothetical protein